MPQILKNLSEFCKKTNILKESCPKNVVLMKTKNNTFLTFLNKMKFSPFYVSRLMPGFVHMGK